MDQQAGLRHVIPYMIRPKISLLQTSSFRLLLLLLLLFLPSSFSIPSPLLQMLAGALSPAFRASRWQAWRRPRVGSGRVGAGRVWLASTGTPGTVGSASAGRPNPHGVPAGEGRGGGGVSSRVRRTLHGASPRPARPRLAPPDPGRVDGTSHRGAKPHLARS